MRKSILITSSIAIAVTAIVISCTDSSAKADKKASVSSNEEKIKRGEYLVNIIGCDDCHSPKKMGPQGPEIIPELRLSGFNKNSHLPEVELSAINKGWVLLPHDLTAAAGPWGISYAGNITSDATGIGNWPEENFIRALRTGKYKGVATNRDLLPPMPWFVYKNMTDEDLSSIFAYLKTTTPVNNVVPAPTPIDKIKSK
jgi:hypothetical protein